MGRTSPGSTGRGYRTTRGTSLPPTALGRAEERTAAAPTGRTAIAGRTVVSPATRVVPGPVPRRSSSGLYVLVAAVLLVGAGAGHWYFNLREAATGGTNTGTSSATTTPSPEVLNSRFAFAEDLLGKGQVAQAFEVVQIILTIAPDNERALELQARIQEASEKKGTG